MKRLLVIEDNSLSAEALADLLRSRGQECDTAGDADAALARMESRDYPAGVVIDHHLPGPTDGLALARRLRERPPYTAAPLVLVTAAAEPVCEAIRRALWELQPAALLRKPFAADDLLAALGSLRPPPVAGEG